VQSKKKNVLGYAMNEVERGRANGKAKKCERIQKSVSENT
jgi:phage-related protein